MKKKVYVLTLSERFPFYHPKAGEATGFKDKLLKEKHHTVRGNAEFWEGRARKINDHLAVLSIRVWVGKPYAKGSTQRELACLDHLNCQRVTLGTLDGKPFAHVETGTRKGKDIPVGRIARNDGLSRNDFIDWFRLMTIPKDFHGVILHLTDTRY